MIAAILAALAPQSAPPVRLQQLQEFRVENGDSTAVARDRAGRLLASGGGAGDLIVWEIASRRELWRFDAGARAVSAIAFDAAGERLAALAIDVVVLEAASGRELRRFATYRGGAVAWSDDGRWFAHTFGARQVLLRSAADYTVQQRLTLVDTDGPITVLAFAAGGDALAVGDETGALATFATTTGEPIARHEVAAPIRALRWQDDGAVACAPATDLPLAPHAHATEVHALAFSGDGRHLVACGGETVFLDVASGAAHRQAPQAAVAAGATGSEVWLLAERRADLWQASPPRLVRSLTLPLSDGLPSRAATSADGRWLAVWGETCGGSVVDLLRGDGTPLAGDALAFAWAPDSRRLVKVGGARVPPGKGVRPMGHLQVWSVGENRAAESLLASPSQAAVWFGSDDVVFGTPGGSLHRLRVADRVETEVFDLRVEWLASLPDGHLLSHDGQQLAVHDRQRLGEAQRLPLGRIDHATLSPEGRHLAVADGCRVRVFSLGR